jgi:hypothetical protein
MVGKVLAMSVVCYIRECHPDAADWDANGCETTPFAIPIALIAFHFTPNGAVRQAKPSSPRIGPEIVAEDKGDAAAWVSTSPFWEP